MLSIPGLDHFKGLQVRDGRLSQDYGSNSGDGQAQQDLEQQKYRLLRQIKNLHLLLSPSCCTAEKSDEGMIHETLSDLLKGVKDKSFCPQRSNLLGGSQEASARYHQAAGGTVKSRDVV